MIRFTLIQARIQLAIAFFGLAVIGLVLLITKQDLVNAMALCNKNQTCEPNDASILSVYSSIYMFLQVLILITPALIGIFWGAPLIAVEYENATQRLAWTQSITRTRWLITKLCCLALLSMAFTATLSWITGAWAHPFDALSTTTRFGLFDLRGIAPVAHTALAFVLGVVVGLISKRLVPAMVITVIAYFVITSSAEHYVRPHLVTPRERTAPVNNTNASLMYSVDNKTVELHPKTPSIPKALLVSTKLVDRSGKKPSTPQTSITESNLCPDLNRSMQITKLLSPEQADERMALQDRCLDALGSAYQVRVQYQPASRYWTMQWIESGLYIAISLVLAALSVAYVRRHPA